MTVPSCKSIDYIPLSRVELHVHLDGSLRHETIWELAKKKGIKLPGKGTFQDLKKALTITEPNGLQHFLNPFVLFIPTIIGDLDSIERVAYEFCEDEARNGVIYVEARYSPHFLLPSDVPKTYEALCEVIKAVNRGFKRGENDFKVKARQIICALVGANMIRDVLRLCEHFRDEGVVGLDTAAMSTSNLSEYEEVSLGVDEVLVYQEASRLGIHRTVHAGEIGSAEMVKRAVEEYNSERIGHGYNVLSDPAVYDMCRKKDIHFETCPWSSLLTGAVPLGVNKHPIVRFAEDNLNFSLSSDDPTVTGCFVEEDYRLAASWGLSEAHFVRCNFNAAHSSFLPSNEKKELIDLLIKTYGVKGFEKM